MHGGSTSATTGDALIAQRRTGSDIFGEGRYGEHVDNT
jgi:hypothetical protein